MISFGFSHLPPAPRVLCLGAHCDDIEIGCGGTILSLLAARPDTRVLWLVLSGAGPRQSEAEASAAALLEGAAQVDMRVGSFRDGFFPSQWAGIKETVETARAGFDPHLVLTHSLEDRHQDHRLVAELTWTAFRDHMVLEYEIPKYDGEFTSPNLFVPIAGPVAERKAAHLWQHFPSQQTRPWFREDTFLAVMRLRGVACRAAYAEAFTARKLVLA